MLQTTRFFPKYIQKSTTFQPKFPQISNFNIFSLPPKDPGEPPIDPKTSFEPPGDVQPPRIPRQQTSRLIEPLPGPSVIDWRRKSEVPEVKSEPKIQCQKVQKPQPPPPKSQPVNSPKVETTKCDIKPAHRKGSIGRRDPHPEHVVLDRYGRQIIVKPETAQVLKQLPDLSFLSARTLLYNPEQKQIVHDLGAMINRKMPG